MLTVVFKSLYTTCKDLRFKKQLSKSINAKVLYKYTCYIGKTKQHFLVRQYKHLGTFILTDKALKYTDNGATSI